MTPSTTPLSVHVARIQRTDGFPAERVASFDHGSLTAGEQGIMLATTEHAVRIRLDILWNQLAQTHSFVRVCGYSARHFYKDVGQQEIPRQHPHRVSDSGDHATLH